MGGIAVGEPVPGWLSVADSALAQPTSGIARTEGEATLLLYFTSGTTARPELVEHTQVSYPVGQLSTMFRAGIQPADVHLTVASPGWAEHAWTSMFAPWNAEATVVALRTAPDGAEGLLRTLERCRVTTFWALPTTWRMLTEADRVGELRGGLAGWRGRLPLRELLSAGERLDGAVARRVEQAWGSAIREGFGQTETTALVGVGPGRPVTPGSMGWALPGYDVVLLDPVTRAEATPGPDGTAETMYDGHFHTGDLARRDAGGRLVRVGRMDEVFRSAESRLSPFELETALAEHPAVAEAAAVPSPDACGGVVAKAFVGLADGGEPTAETARGVLQHARSVHHRIERLESAVLPRTAGGKIRRSLLRRRSRGDGPSSPPVAGPASSVAGRHLTRPHP